MSGMPDVAAAEPSAALVSVAVGVVLLLWFLWAVRCSTRMRDVSGREFPCLPSWFPPLGNLPPLCMLIPKDKLGKLIARIIPQYGDKETAFGLLGMDLDIPPLRRKVAMISDPQYARSVLVARPDTCAKFPLYQELKFLLGEGLVTAEGELWRRERRKMNRALTQASVRKMCALCNTHTKDAVAFYRTQLVSAGARGRASGFVMDPARRMAEITLDVIMDTGFGVQTHAKLGKQSAFSDAVQALMAEGIQRVTDLPWFREIIRSRRWKTIGPHYDLVCKQVEDMVRSRLAKRREASERGEELSRRDDLLDVIMDAMYGRIEGERGSEDQQTPKERSDSTGSAGSLTVDTWTADEEAKIASAVSQAATGGGEEEVGLDGAPLGDDDKALLKQVLDHCVTFTLAGHETTSGLLSWLILHLCEHPDLQDRLRSEVRAVLRTAAEEQGVPIEEVDVSQEVVAQMPFLRNMLKETLRLTPSVALVERDVLKPLTIAREATVTEEAQALAKGRPVPRKTRFDLDAGYGVVVSLYGLHRNPLYWREPEMFNPDRWEKPYEPVPGNEDGEVLRHPFQFIPFAAGPRNCIGQSFALVEASVIVAHLVQNFVFAAEHIPSDPYFEAITSHPQNVLVRLTPATQPSE